MKMLPVPSAAIRKADQRDLAAVHELLKLMHAETARYARCDDKTQAHITDCIDNHLVLVTEQDGVVVGTIGIRIAEPWYSRQAILHDTWLFVLPEHRRAPHARNLINAAVVFAEMHNLPLEIGFTLKPTLLNRFKAMARLFGRVLGQPVGLAFYLPMKG